MEFSIPPALQARPYDEKRNLPIPLANCFPDGTHDFTTVSGEQIQEIAKKNLCGLCGEPLAYWITFLGGSSCIESRVYLDPPMHLECTLAALKLCPFVARSHMKRAPEKRLRSDTVTPAGFVEKHPTEWVVYITRSYKLIRIPQPDGGYVFGFYVAPAKSLIRYRYNSEGVLELHERGVLDDGTKGTG